MTRVPQRFLFAEGELDDKDCRTCGAPLVASDVVENTDGDLVQFAYCPVCGVPDDDEPSLLVPRALLKVNG